jgi:hypothetical protein
MGVVAAVTLVAASSASATPAVSLTSAFAATALGEDVTFTSTMTFTGTEYAGSPQPVTSLLLHLPAGAEGSSAGFPVCERQTLEMFGPIKCPPESSTGPVTTATAYVTFGDERVEESTEVSGYFGPGETVTFFLDGHSPVSLEILVAGVIRPASNPFGRTLELTLPLVASVPGAPYASLRTLTLAFGGSRVVDGLESASVTIPRECPAGGFAWSVEGGFSDGTSALASALSPCLQVVAAPVQGQVEGVRVTTGTVTIRRPGSTTFEPLSGVGAIPNGSELNTVAGQVAITAATAIPGRTQMAQVHGGRLLIDQDDTSDAETHLTLSAPLTGCRSTGRRGRGASAASSHHGRKSRHLWVSEHGGNWGTNGHYVSTSVEGTSWLTEDSCSESEVKVLAGRVRVHDLVRNKTTTLTAGQHYTAFARRR